MAPFWNWGFVVQGKDNENTINNSNVIYDAVVTIHFIASGGV
jgi:hypothetical protein